MRLWIVPIFPLACSSFSGYVFGLAAPTASCVSLWTVSIIVFFLIRVRRSFRLQIQWNVANVSFVCMTVCPILWLLRVFFAVRLGTHRFALLPTDAHSTISVCVHNDLHNAPLVLAMVRLSIQIRLHQKGGVFLPLLQQAATLVTRGSRGTSRNSGQV